MQEISEPHKIPMHIRRPELYEPVNDTHTPDMTAKTLKEAGLKPKLKKF
jgi:hypothetical protein